MFADQLESAQDFTGALNHLIRHTIREHKRIIFNGNNYSEEWEREAAQRGLLNLRTTPDALPWFIHEKNLTLFEKHKIYTSAEAFSRYEILLENYCKTLNIEALTMVDMARRQILPAVLSYQKHLSDVALQKKNLLPDVNCLPEIQLLQKISKLSAAFYPAIEELEQRLETAKEIENLQREAEYYKDAVLPCMQKLRSYADKMELLVGQADWPFPSYGQLLFHI